MALGLAHTPYASPTPKTVLPLVSQIDSTRGTACHTELVWGMYCTQPCTQIAWSPILISLRARVQGQSTGMQLYTVSQSPRQQAAPTVPDPAHVQPPAA